MLGTYLYSESDSQILCNFYQTSDGVFMELEKIILKFISLKKRPKIENENLKHKSNAECTTVHNFKA